MVSAEFAGLVKVPRILEVTLFSHLNANLWLPMNVIKPTVRKVIPDTRGNKWYQIKTIQKIWCSPGDGGYFIYFMPPLNKSCPHMYWYGGLTINGQLKLYHQKKKKKRISCWNKKYFNERRGGKKQYSATSWKAGPQWRRAFLIWVHITHIHTNPSSFSSFYCWVWCHKTWNIMLGQSRQDVLAITPPYLLLTPSLFWGGVEKTAFM